MALREKIEDNYSAIMRCLEPSSELLGRLRSVAFVKDHICSIRQQATIDNKSDALLAALLEVPDDLQESVMNSFIATLRSSGQDHVANIFHQESDKVPMSDEHYLFLNKKMHEICQFLDPRDGLIDYLLSSEVFTSANSNTVHSILAVDDMAHETVRILQRKSDDSFQTFICALRETEQDHVVHIITGDGKLPMSKERRKLLQSKKEELEMFCDPENGIVSALAAAGVISHRAEARIRNKTNLNNMARELVETLIRESDDAFDVFIKALNKTGQGHVTYILTGEGDSQPVSEECRTKLTEKRSAIVKSIYAKCLVSTLISKGVFSSHDQHRVESQLSDTEKGELMIDLIARKSHSAFDRFIDTLKECHHEHVAGVLTSLEVVGEIQIQVDVDEETVPKDRVEVSELCDNMQQAFRDNDTQVKMINETLILNGISVSDIEHGSVIIKFKCRDHAALASLKKLYFSNKLDQLFTEAFASSCADKGLEALNLKIADDEFERHNELRLITDEHHKALLSSKELLVEKLIVGDELLDRLSLCPRRRQTIERAATPQQQVKTLLDIISRQPDSAFTQLLNALRATEQQDVATIISGDSSEHAKKCPASVFRKMHAEGTGNTTEVALNINS